MMRLGPKLQLTYQPGKVVGRGPPLETLAERHIQTGGTYRLQIAIPQPIGLNNPAIKGIGDMIGKRNQA